MITYEEFERAFKQGWILEFDNLLFYYDGKELLFSRDRWGGGVWIKYGGDIQYIYSIIVPKYEDDILWYKQSRRYA